MTDNHNAAPHGFIEDLSTSDEGHYDFDWAGLSRALGEGDLESAAEEQRLKFANSLRELLRWMVDEIKSKHCHSKRTEIVGRRAMMLAWVVDPDLMDGSSQSAIAKSCGLNKVYLSKIAAEVHNKFGIMNRAQRAHGWQVREPKGGKG